MRGGHVGRRCCRRHGKHGPDLCRGLRALFCDLHRLRGLVRKTLKNYYGNSHRRTHFTSPARLFIHRHDLAGEILSI